MYKKILIVGALFFSAFLLNTTTARADTTGGGRASIESTETARTDGVLSRTMHVKLDGKADRLGVVQGRVAPETRHVDQLAGLLGAQVRAVAVRLRPRERGPGARMRRVRLGVERRRRRQQQPPLAPAHERVDRVAVVVVRRAGQGGPVKELAHQRVARTGERREGRRQRVGVRLEEGAVRVQDVAVEQVGRRRRPCWLFRDDLSGARPR